MPGYLIDGVFIAASEIGAIAFFKLGKNAGGSPVWLPCKSTAEYMSFEGNNAIQITMKCGKEFLCERVVDCKNIDGRTLLNSR